MLQMHPPRQTCWEKYFTLEYLAQRHWTPKLFFPQHEWGPAYLQDEPVSCAWPWRNDLALSREEMVNFLPLWQEFQWNDSLGPGGSGSARTPSAAEQFGNPTAATALGSLEPGEVPAVAFQGQKQKPAAVSQPKLQPEELCKAFPGVWWRQEERAGHQLHLVIAESFRISSSALLPRYSLY